MKVTVPLTIEHCFDCPYQDYSGGYDGWGEGTPLKCICSKKHDKRIDHPEDIPDWCPYVTK